ncbi:hypothetical protein JQ616_20275 [Bradyrhizobium tropiciagri]|uniref:hypothetical protein n=1 Tax=Bradyrhizobium tropiciagri TaxID=312253 RepID=UPI001BA9B290|nr:hypothetical protein [Bradyrhizobium tropiciagri]MBR0897298.1 hypothetical protein [Bradyrhizobium tropiciagri]
MIYHVTGAALFSIRRSGIKIVLRLSSGAAGIGSFDVAASFGMTGMSGIAR